MSVPVMRLPAATGHADEGMRLAPWALVLFGLVALYGPSLADALRNANQADDVVNALFVLAVSGWFLRFRVRKLLQEDRLEQQGAAFGGGLLLICGLVLYALGRSQQLPTLEIGSLIPVLAGIVAVFFGFRTLRRLWLALFLLLFLIPLPPSVASEITQPVKIAVSIAAETLLHGLGYPVARDGVVIAIGQYQLLVADACSGLRSLFTLEALGLMYLSFLGHASAMRNSVLALLIVPISFTANTLRVVTLALITYYLGYAAGQGFLHNFSGIVLFLSALLLIVGADVLLARSARTDAQHGDR